MWLMSWKHGSLRVAVAPLALPRPAKERPRGSSPKSPSPVEINMVHKDKDTCVVKVEVIAMALSIRNPCKSQVSQQMPTNAYKCLKNMHSRSHQKQLPKLRQYSSANLYTFHETCYTKEKPMSTSPAPDAVDSWSWLHAINSSQSLSDHWSCGEWNCL